MEGIKRIIIEAEVKEDDRMYINFSKFSDDVLPNRFEVLSILVSSLVMSTKLACSDLDYESQGKLIDDVFTNLKKDLFSGDSFKDMEIKIDEL
jgi:hypothetical protein